MKGLPIAVDHAGNAAELKAWTGAPVYAHPLDQAHLEGKFPYAGFAQVCGALEAAGRAVTNYTPVKIDMAPTTGARNRVPSAIEEFA